MKYNMKLIEMDYHRNGVGGAGFWVFKFDWAYDGGRETEEFWGTYPDADHRREDAERTDGHSPDSVVFCPRLGVEHAWRGADHCSPIFSQWIDSYKEVRNEEDIKWWQLTHEERMDKVRERISFTQVP